MLLRWLILSLSLLPVQAAWGLTSISVYKTFTAEILTVADLNSSFTRLLDSGINPLIALHPGDSTSTARGVHDSLDARTAGNNIGVVRSLVFRDQDDSLVVGGTADFDTVRADSFTMVQGNRATFRSRTQVDTLQVGSATPTVGFTHGFSPAGARTTFSSLVAIDSLRIRDSLQMSPGARAFLPRLRVDTLLVGSATPTVGFTHGFSPAGASARTTFSSLVAIDTLRIRDSTTVAGPASFLGSVSLPTSGGGDLFVGNGNGAVIGNSAQVTAGTFVQEMQVLGTAQGVDSAILTGNWSTTDDEGPRVAFLKSGNGTIGSFTIVGSSENLGDIIWHADDGVDYAGAAARIGAEMDGTPGSNDLPGRLMFYTTLDGANGGSERVRIDNAGNVTIDVDGTMNAGDHDLEIHSSTNCSELDASETSFTNCSSYSGWKTGIAPVNEKAVLANFDSLRVRQYYYKESKLRSDMAYPDSATAADSAKVEAQIAVEVKVPHVGFVADWIYPVTSAVSPKADTTSYSMDHVVMAMLIKMHDLQRQVDSLKALH